MSPGRHADVMGRQDDREAGPVQVCYRLQHGERGGGVQVAGGLVAEQETGIVDESETLEEAKNFFQKELNAEIHVCHEEDAKRHDPKQRAQLAKPYRPAIYIE